MNSWGNNHIALWESHPVLVSNLGKLIYQETNPGKTLLCGDTQLQTVALGFEVLGDVRGNALRSAKPGADEPRPRPRPLRKAARPEEPRRPRPLCVAAGHFRPRRAPAVGPRAPRSPAPGFISTLGRGLWSPPQKVVSPAVSSK